MGKNDSPRPKQTVDKESTTADTEGLNTEKETFSTSESELLDSMPKVIAYVEEMAQVGAEEFALVCFDEMLNGAYNNS